MAQQSQQQNDNMDRKTTRYAAILPVLLTLFACSDDENGRIVLGRGFQTSVLNTLQYQTPVVVQVSKNDGSPSAGAVATISVRVDGYFKGIYNAVDLDNPPDGIPEEWRAVYSAGGALCPNEDLNSNGVLDGTEDTNGNGVLDPAGAATISAHPTELPTVSPGTNTITTDESGFGYFSLTYPKSEGNWVQVTLTAKVGDGSPGNTQTDTFTLPVILNDLDDPNISPPGGTTGAYGSANFCTDPA